MKTFVILGGGAAGFFAALTAKQLNPKLNVIILEKSAKLLSKVRISGGGRCNVTHACFDPKALIENYPRGAKELLGPFHEFQPKDTINWFETRGVPLKKEKDGRMFPTTDSSQTIIDALLRESEALNIKIILKEEVKSVIKTADGFDLVCKNNNFKADYLFLATGSHPSGYLLAKNFSHTIVEPIPSLFTFNIPNFSLKELSGASVQKVHIYLSNKKQGQSGPLLITHFGFSGPAALKLSAFEARTLFDQNYNTELHINWTFDHTSSIVYEQLKQKDQTLKRIPPFDLPKKLWLKMLEQLGIDSSSKYNGLSNKALRKIADKLTNDTYRIEGKTTNKEEFVTCGGISLSEINFKTMESKLTESLYFGGEILDIDGITGGFNFQNGWTTGYLAGKAVAKKASEG